MCGHLLRLTVSQVEGVLHPNFHRAARSPVGVPVPPQRFAAPSVLSDAFSGCGGQDAGTSPPEARYNREMARLFPFRALRYDPARVQMTDVVTQPYDKISSEMQDRYYQASPDNLIRVILGKANARDNEKDNVYSRAAATLRDWRAEGILRQEAEPALYGYSQTYTVPGSTEVR